MLHNFARIGLAKKSLNIHTFCDFIPSLHISDASGRAPLKGLTMTIASRICGATLTAGLSIFATAASASADINNPFNGMYVTAGIGGVSQNWKTVAAGEDESNPISAAQRATNTSFSAGMTAGYGMQVFGPVNFGSKLEVMVIDRAHMRGSFTNEALQNSGDVITTTAGHSFSPMMRLGYVISPRAMLFARLGVATSTVTAANHVTEASEQSEICPSGNIRHSFTRSRIGFCAEYNLPGLNGVNGQATVFYRLFIRADVAYTLGTSKLSAATDTATFDQDAALTPYHSSNEQWDFRSSLGLRL